MHLQYTVYHNTSHITVIFYYRGISVSCLVRWFMTKTDRFRGFLHIGKKVSVIYIKHDWF